MLLVRIRLLLDLDTLSISKLGPVAGRRKDRWAKLSIFFLPWMGEVSLFPLELLSGVTISTVTLLCVSCFFRSFIASLFSEESWAI